MTPKTLFLQIAGAPHESDLVTTVLRITQEALDQGHSVQVWACGYSTMLTQKTLTNHKPGTFLGPESDADRFPSTASIIQHLIQAHEGRLHWCVCDYCKNDRGANDQIEEVEVMLAMGMIARMNMADVSMVMGTF